MRGNEPAVRDLNIVLEDLVLPANLLSNENLDSDEDEVEEESQCPYKIDTCCSNCQVALRLFVTATSEGIRTFEQLLLSAVTIICPKCAKERRHGRIQ